MGMELSSYQKEILDFFIKNPSTNMVIEAFAGCGKSSTILELTKHTTTSDVYLAFNSAIAQEFREKIKNPKTKVYTLHSLALQIMNYNLSGGTPGSAGWGTQRDTLSGMSTGKANLDNLKIYKIVGDMVTAAFGRKVKWDERVFLQNNFVTLYNLARLTCSMGNSYSIRRLIKDHALFIDLEGANEHFLSDTEIIAWLNEIDERSLQEFELTNTIDFTDMIYITLRNMQKQKWRPAPYQYYTNIYVDESHDASPALLMFIKYIKRKNGRYVFVLDEHQAIYNFAGAGADSVKKIKELFVPNRVFDLPINYRCPAGHLKYVRDRFNIPIQARPNAPEGEIVHINKEDIKKYVKPGDMIISRKNKWLANLLIDLAIAGIPVYIEDKEMVDSIKKLITKQKQTRCKDLLKIFTDMVESTEKKVASMVEENEKAETPMAPLELEQNIAALNYKLGNVKFTVALLSPFMESKKKSNSVNDFLTYLDTILNTTFNKRCVRICSVHKAKGLEAPQVFVLNEAQVCMDFRNSPEQQEQEVNLAYISVTRATETLYLVKEESEKDKSVSLEDF